MVIWLLALACIRPTDFYDVQIHGEATQLQQVEPAPSPMGGRIELARYRLYGQNLGHGVTGLFGDAPRADGTGFVIGSAVFGYPASSAYDRKSAFLTAGPTMVDSCHVRSSDAGYVGTSEYVDVGDHVAFGTPGRVHVALEREPTAHPRPAGESWSVGYGEKLLPIVEDHPQLPDTWKPGATWSVSFPGTIQPNEATVGAIPYPLTQAFLHLPLSMEGVTIGGEAVRPPVHGDEDDPVRFAGPWASPMEIGWTTTRSEGHVTLVLRLHGAGVEGVCDCSTDCDWGFTCDEGACVGDDGAGWSVLAEVACTVADDGEFSLTREHTAGLWNWVDLQSVAGATLSIARINEATTFVPDVLTWNGKRVGINPVRLRASDIIVTRVEAP